VHQFCRVGEGVMFRGGAIATKHIPPFVMVADMNAVAGLNLVDIRRNPNLTPRERADLRDAYRAFYAGKPTRPLADRLDALRALDLAPAAQRFRAFIEDALSAEGRFRRGLAGRRHKRGAAHHEDDE